MQRRIKKLNIRGFAHVELITAILVIVGFGVVGSYVASHQAAKKPAGAAANLDFEVVGAGTVRGQVDIFLACRNAANTTVTFKQQWGITTPPTIFWYINDENVPGGPRYKTWDVETGYISLVSGGLPYTTLPVSSGHTNWLQWSLNDANWSSATREGTLAIC